MVLRNNNPLVPDVRKIQILDNAVANIIQGQGGLIDQLTDLNQNVQSLLNTRANVIASPVANLFLNGELGHSVFTWNEVVGPPSGDKNAECEDWYSHNTPSAAQTFNSTNVNTGTDTVTITNHGFTNGCSVDLLAEAGGTLPAGITTGVTYFLIVVDANTLQFAATIGDAEASPAVPINLTTTGTAAKIYTIQQVLISTNDYTSAVNNELKTIAHSTYDPRYSRWDPVNGQGDLTGTTSIDVLMPSNNVDATTSLARISLIAARLNAFIEIPENALMGTGIWDNTSGQRKFLTGDIGFTAVLVGATGAVTRKFKAFYESDRGYTLLSSEVTIANTPADGALSATDNIAMAWLQQAGQLQVEIYEHYDPGGPDDSFRLVTQVSSATSFIYEGGYLRTVSGYPTPTETERTATFFTQTADMSDLSINGVALTWDTVNFPIGVPNNYNKGNTTNREWGRIWMTVAANLFIEGVTTDGSATITIPAGAVNSAAVASGGYGTGSTSLYAGLVAKVYDVDDVLLSTTSVSSVTSNTVLVLAGSIAAGSNRKLRIVAGGFHGILIDKIHLGYQQNTSYAPNALDNRTLQPVAAPASSDQGGVGGGGSGGGIDTCVAGRTPVKMHNGERIPISQTRPGQQWNGGNLKPNLLIKLKPSKELINIRRVRSANGVEIECTDGEAFMTEAIDYRGTALFKLRVGDPILTEIDGRIEQSTIAEISPYLRKEIVYTPSLSDNHLFIAGELSLSLWQRMVNRIRGRRQIAGGFVAHNVKPLNDPLDGGPIS